MTKKYNALEHSVVQAFMKPDATHEFEIPEYVEALVRAIHRRVELVYMDWNQEVLENREDWQFLDIPGFEYRRYYWGDEETECGLPNIKFDNVTINWYKYIGRGMSTNVDWGEIQWVEWFDRAVKTIRFYGSCYQLTHQKFRDQDAGIKPFTTNTRTQCKDCKYCVQFGPNEKIWTRSGSTDVSQAE